MLGTAPPHPSHFLTSPLALQKKQSSSDSAETGRAPSATDNQGRLLLSVFYKEKFYKYLYIILFSFLPDVATYGYSPGTALYSLMSCVKFLWPVFMTRVKSWKRVRTVSVHVFNIHPNTIYIYIVVTKTDE